MTNGAQRFERLESLPINPLEVLRDYKATQIERLELAESILEEALPVLGSVETINHALDRAGRPDLAISEQVDLLKADNLEDLKKTTSFRAGFSVVAHLVETGEVDEYTQIPETKSVLATTAEIMALRDLPKLTDEELDKLRRTKEFPAITYVGFHTDKLAFLRLLNLYPQFIEKFYDDMNDDKVSEFRAMFYVAYQLMSRLVDVNDPYVQKEGGTIDEAYLCR